MSYRFMDKKMRTDVVFYAGLALIFLIALDFDPKNIVSVFRGIRQLFIFTR